MKLPKTIGFHRDKFRFNSWQSVLTQSVVYTHSRNTNQLTRIFTQLR